MPSDRDSAKHYYDRKKQDNSRDRDRSRSSRDKRSSKKRSRSRSRSRSPAKNGKSEELKGFQLEGALILGDGPLDKEVEAKRLELEMQKRRDRIERWRAERQKQKDEEEQKDVKPDIKLFPVTSMADSDEEDANVKQEPVDENEIDPLDAFMAEMQKEAKKNTGPPVIKPVAGSQPSKGNVTIIKAVIKKQEDSALIAKKGELMDVNADAMEYSSEDEDTLDNNTNNAKKEKLSATDHTKIYYSSFQKEFYREPPELAKLSDEDVTVLREQLGGIRAKGKNVPKPIRTWAESGLTPKILGLLKKNGFARPTPIQCQALPIILSGRDMIGIAATGSGKTLAFLLPLLIHVKAQPAIQVGDGPIAIVMTPTRELALQIFKETKKFTKILNLNVVCVYGGTGISEQIAELKRGCEIIVCTPGRMIDMLAANSGRVTNLRRTTFCVLDEADRMFDLGFEPQVNKIVDSVRPDRQTVMFSATFPRQMEVLARKSLLMPVEVVVGGKAVVCSEVMQDVVLLTEEEKFFKLLELLGIYQEQGGCLIFVDRQEKADELMRLLLRHSYPCMSLHGGIDQYDRDSIITDFKSGDNQLLIATSVAARGLDVTGLILVVNYDCPNHYEDYVHRCGRTGRAGKTGNAYTFITRDQEKFAGDLIRALQLSNTPIPEDLQIFYDEYVKRMESEGKKVKSKSGFTSRCKGFAFDEEESKLIQEKRKFQKAAMGLGDSDDEDPNIDDQIEELFASKKRVKNVAESFIQQGGSKQNQAESVLAKLEMAKHLAQQLKSKGDATSTAAHAILKGAPVAHSTLSVSSKTVAEQTAERLNARLGYQRSEETLKEEATVQRYEEELEINDFPQNVRWRLTSREFLNHIAEFCEVGISVRGQYMTNKPPPSLPNQEPLDSSDRPLFLLLESISEFNIQNAKKEVTRTVKDELLRLQSSTQLNRLPGRYKVV